MAASTREDQAARELWGDAYGAIPKSVFAVAAWYLSDCASDEGVGNGGELRRFREELEALKASGILPEPQVKRAMRALAAIDEQQGATR